MLQYLVGMNDIECVILKRQGEDVAGSQLDPSKQASFRQGVPRSVHGVGRSVKRHDAPGRHEFGEVRGDGGRAATDVKHIHSRVQARKQIPGRILGTSPRVPGKHRRAVSVSVTIRLASRTRVNTILRHVMGLHSFFFDYSSSRRFILIATHPHLGIRLYSDSSPLGASPTMVSPGLTAVSPGLTACKYTIHGRYERARAKSARECFVNGLLRRRRARLRVGLVSSPMQLADRL